MGRNNIETIEEDNISNVVKNCIHIVEISTIVDFKKKENWYKQPDPCNLPKKATELTSKTKSQKYFSRKWLCIYRVSNGWRIVKLSLCISPHFYVMCFDIGKINSGGQHLVSQLKCHLGCPSPQTSYQDSSFLLMCTRSDNQVLGAWLLTYKMW